MKKLIILAIVALAWGVAGAEADPWHEGLKDDMMILDEEIVKEWHMHPDWNPLETPKQDKDCPCEDRIKALEERIMELEDQSFRRNLADDFED